MIAVAIPRKELGTRAEARTREVERCLKMNPTFIYMSDSDQTFPNRSIGALVGQGADIACIDAPSKGYDDSNVRWHPDGTLAYATISCCLIRSTVFNRIEKPWFSSEYAFIETGVKDGKITWNVQKKSHDDGINEDIYFIRKCLEAGVDVKVVPALKCKHFNLGDE